MRGKGEILIKIKSRKRDINLINIAQCDPSDAYWLHVIQVSLPKPAALGPELVPRRIPGQTTQSHTAWLNQQNAVVCRGPDEADSGCLHGLPHRRTYLSANDIQLESVKFSELGIF